MSTRKPTRPASGRRTAGGANQDIINFLNKTGAPKANLNRQDSGLTRASEELSGRGGTVRPKNGHLKPPSGLGDYGTGDGEGGGGADYGARKRNPYSAADKNDKIIEIERENNTLKEKENFLQQEIKMMSTKLRRVEALIKSRGRTADEYGDYDAQDMAMDLKSECDDIRD